MIASYRLLQGSAIEQLRALPDESVHCVVSSPPYWGLRDYGAAGQVGLEPTPDLYVERMVEVFREVRRVLRPDGTLWLNLGDCYATGAGKVGEHPGGSEQGARWRGDVDRIRDDKRGYRGDRLANGRGDSPAVLRKKTRATRDGTHAGKHTAMAALGPMTQPNRMPIPGLKPKDLVGIPWRVAFALQADGWWLRSDIIWSKPNPMPESVRDRPTRAHEYLFLLTKSERYFYDSEAVREPDAGLAAGGGFAGRQGGSDRVGPLSGGAGSEQPWTPGGGRNKRSVWSIATHPFPEAHFATFPENLVEPCILAGTSARGCCASCGAPVVRIVERERLVDGEPAEISAARAVDRANPRSAPQGIGHGRIASVSRTSGWESLCACEGGGNRTLHSARSVLRQRDDRRRCAEARALVRRRRDQPRLRRDEPSADRSSRTAAFAGGGR